MGCSSELAGFRHSHVAGFKFPITPWFNPQCTIPDSIASPTTSANVGNPDQSLSFDESLRAYTPGSAFAGFNEDIKGRIKQGKLADHSVWKKDPAELDPITPAKTSIDMTLIGVEIIFKISQDVMNFLGITSLGDLLESENYH